MDRTEAMIRDAVQKEVTNCDTCQRTKLSDKKYGKLRAKFSEKIPCNKLCVDIIGTYVIRIKRQKKTYI